jgi:SAM-dependent methyltransferase
MRFIKFLNYWWSSIFTFRNPISTGRHLISFLKDWYEYKNIIGSEKIKIIDSQPQIFDRSVKTPFDTHYVYQSYWAFQHIQSKKPKFHIDLGSQVQHNVLLSLFTPVFVVDIRPFQGDFSFINHITSDIQNLPFSSNSVESISCLHVIEHIGLGRYGDKLNPFGTKESCKEISRVLKPGGNLFLSLPVGNSRLCFNSHRIHNPNQILDYLNDLSMIEFSGIDDDGNFLQNIEPNDLEKSEYACGLFWMTK